MAEDKDRKRDMAIVYGGIKISFMINAVLLPFLYFLAPLGIPDPVTSTPVSRIVFAIQWLFPAFCVLGRCVMDVGNTRASTKARNPLDKDSQDVVAVPKNVLQNTIEQLLLFSAGLLILSTYIEPYQMKIIPTLSIQFVIGRLLFRWGYHQPCNLYRARGFAMNLFVTAAMYLFIAWKFVTNTLLV